VLRSKRHNVCAGASAWWHLAACAAAGDGVMAASAACGARLFAAAFWRGVLARHQHVSRWRASRQSSRGIMAFARIGA